MPQPTAYSHINTLLEQLLADMQAILGDRLVGLYLYGSLVTGDFLEGVSDLDLLAAITSDLDPAEFDALNRMHHAFVRQYPQWHDRVEIAYLSLHGLRTFKTQSSKIGIISPGEPFHIIDAGSDWSINWYMVQEIGVTLYGPPPEDIIEPVTSEEFQRVVENHARHWREWAKDMHSRPSQAYAIITLCRALYTLTHGEQVSKVQAATWTAQALPQWSALINKALHWRQTSRDNIHDNQDDEASLPETLRFVNFMVDRISG